MPAWQNYNTHMGGYSVKIYGVWKDKELFWNFKEFWGLFSCPFLSPPIGIWW